MSIITKTDNGIIYKLKDELVCIEAYGRDIIRVRITRNSTLITALYISSKTSLSASKRTAGILSVCGLRETVRFQMKNGLCLMWRTVPSRQRLQRGKPL